MEKKKIEYIAVAAIFGILGLVVLYNLAGLRPGKKPAEKEATSENYRDQLAKAEMMVKRLPQQKLEVAEIRARLEKHVNELPPESDHTWLSRQIAEIAREAGVRDVSQRYNPAAISRMAADQGLRAKYAEKFWEVRMRSGYHELGDFLSRLERANRFLEVTDISMDGNEPGGQKIVILIRYLVRKGR